MADRDEYIPIKPRRDVRAIAFSVPYKEQADVTCGTAGSGVFVLIPSDGVLYGPDTIDRNPLRQASRLRS